MSQVPLEYGADLASSVDALQHRPRPLPLFLHMLRSETADDADRTAAALAGLRAYQAAKRLPPPPPMPIVARVGRAAIRDFGGTGRPVLFVPSLINPPDVLDIDHDRSLLRWLATQGINPLLVDWGVPSAADHGSTIADHVETLLLGLIAALGRPPVLVGYCLGGTMALAAARLTGAPALGLIASPWNFAGYPATTLGALDALWEQSHVGAEALGMLPMEVLQTAFWRIDPHRTITKYEAFGRRPADHPDAQAFVRLEDWANDGPPLTYQAARELFEDFYGSDVTGRGAWRVGGMRIDPADIATPVLQIASTTDHIVPAAASAVLGDAIPLALGHVGMIVGSRARAQVWTPLARWLSQLGSS